MRGLLITGAVVVAVLVGGKGWWRGETVDGAFLAHLALGHHNCSESASTERACRRLSAHPFQIVLNDGHGRTPILTADAHGDVSAMVPPGDYQVAWSTGDAGLRTNEGTRLIHIGSGQAINVGVVRPADGALFIVGQGF